MIIRAETVSSSRRRSKSDVHGHDDSIYPPDDLFERILVQAHRRDRTISEYAAGILEPQVPDHRIARAEPAGESTEAGAA